MSYNPITGALLPQSPVLSKSVSFTRPANTTQYAVGDAVAPATKAVSAASNATPIVITTSTAHGLATDDRVFLASVGGNTNANGIRKVVVLTSTTFALYNEATGAAIAGNANWTSGGTVQPLLRMADVVPAGGGTGAIIGLQLQVKNATVTSGTFRVRFFNLPIDQIADNAAFTLLVANQVADQGYVDLAIIATDGSGSDMSEVVSLLAQPLPFSCGSNRTDLYVQLIALGTFTPASGDTFRLVANIRRDQVPGLATVSSQQ